jgi:hypothetical protein
MWVYLPAYARFQTFAWLRQIPCNYHFLGGIIQTRDVMSWSGPWPFQLNSCKNFKKRVRKLVSKRRVESVKEGVIGYIIPQTSSEWQVIKIAWQNTDIARKADSRMAMNCQSYCYGIFPFCILFWDHSHPLTKHVLFFSLCCFEINRCLAFHSDKIFWSNSNMR